MTSNCQLIHGNSLEKLRDLADASVESCVTDPPYEIGFMSRKWDDSGIAYNVALWREVYRVLKPGGHLASFGGTRTFHRMAVAIEDAGFEIRDQLAWCYGSGFPKSLNVSNAIDRHLGVEPRIIGERKVIPGVAFEQSTPYATGRVTVPVTVPVTVQALAYSGWGTALKPAWEPICLGRKPFKGTVAGNVIKHGTGAMNIEASRVPFLSEEDKKQTTEKNQHAEFASGPTENNVFRPFAKDREDYDENGRFPANLIHDGSTEVVACFPDDGFASASRFFYTAKASAEDREAGLREADAGVGALREGGRGAKRINIHPTVKPTDLMVWLVRLITPDGGTVIDPFMGSGSTGRAAAICNLNFIGIDMTAEYIPIARARIDEARGELFCQPQTPEPI